VINPLTIACVIDMAYLSNVYDGNAKNKPAISEFIECINLKVEVHRYS
jgi:hypothetical protein